MRSPWANALMRLAFMPPLSNTYQSSIQARALKDSFNTYCTSSKKSNKGLLLILMYCLFCKDLSTASLIALSEIESVDRTVFLQQEW